MKRNRKARVISLRLISITVMLIILLGMVCIAASAETDTQNVVRVGY